MITRSEAIALGLRKYDAHKECLRGHLGERYLNGHCCECNCQSQKERREKQPKFHAEYCRSWRNKNRERVSEYCRTYRISHRYVLRAKALKRSIKERAAYRAIKELGINI